MSEIVICRGYNEKETSKLAGTGIGRPASRTRRGLEEKRSELLLYLKQQLSIEAVADCEPINFTANQVQGLQFL
jgi:hypothetical protein